MDTKKRYNTLKRKVIKTFSIKRIKPFIPTPNEDDYKTGYIERFFAQKANDKNAIIYEVTGKNFLALSANPFFQVVKLNWKISGTDDEIKKINKKVVTYASKSMPGLILYLPNLLQFSKNNLGI